MNWSVCPRIVWSNTLAVRGSAGLARIELSESNLNPAASTSRAHGRGLDAMQGLGYICGSTQSGGMIENYIYATGLQRTVDGLLNSAGVDWAHELIV